MSPHLDAAPGRRLKSTWPNRFIFCTHSHIFFQCRYSSLSLTGDFQPGSNPPGEPYRYTMDVATGAVSATRLAGGLDMDFPVIAAHLVTQPANYTYMSGNEVGTRRYGVM